MPDEFEPDRQIAELQDWLVYAVTEQFFQGVKPTEIARWLVSEHRSSLPWVIPVWNERKAVAATRLKIRKVVCDSHRRDQVRLNPPLEESVRQKIWHRYRLDEEPTLNGTPSKQVRVVNVHGQLQRVRDQLAQAGAEEILALIREIGDAGGANKRVGIGLGAGGTAMELAKRLGRLVNSEPNCPKLALHAITSGFSTNPLIAPITFFRFFNQDVLDIKFYGLFSAPFVNCANYEAFKQQPVVADAYKQADDIDILLTSLASHDDEHGLLNQILRIQDAPTNKWLESKGWLGDVQFLPYSADGPIEFTKGDRPVTLYELSDLVEKTRSGKMHVVLVAGPCNTCGVSKAKALEPLMERENLRVWSRLATDLKTAKELIGEADDEA